MKLTEEQKGLMKALGGRLADARVNAKLNQEEVGEVLGVSGNTVSRWEIGQHVPSALAILELAHLYKKSVSALYGEDRISSTDEEICLSDEEILEGLSTVLDSLRKAQPSVRRLTLIALLQLVQRQEQLQSLPESLDNLEVWEPHGRQNQ